MRFITTLSAPAVATAATVCAQAQTLEMVYL